MIAKPPADCYSRTAGIILYCIIARLRPANDAKRLLARDSMRRGTCGGCLRNSSGRRPGGRARDQLADRQRIALINKVPAAVFAVALNANGSRLALGKRGWTFFSSSPVMS
jgi:hypothetical protein